MFLRTIERRKKEEYQTHALLAEWVAKHISLTVASIAREPKQSVALQKDVLKRVKFDFDDEDDADTEEEAPGAEDDYDFVEKGSRTAMNQAGSLDRLMGGLG